MKSPIIPISLATLFTLLLAATAVRPESTSDANATPVATPRFGEHTLLGSLHAWRIEDDGTVLVAIQTGANKAPVWLRTPANQSSTTQFELLTLHAVLALDHPDRDAKLTVRGESTTERDGADAEHAMQLLAIGRVN